MEAISDAIGKLSSYYNDESYDLAPGDVGFDADEGSGRFYLLHLNSTNPISRIFCTWVLFAFTAITLSVFSLAFIGLINRFLINVEDNTTTGGFGKRRKRSSDNIDMEQILRLLHEMDENLRRLDAGGNEEAGGGSNLSKICRAVKRSRNVGVKGKTDEVDNVVRLLDIGRNILEDHHLTSSKASEGPLGILQSYISAGLESVAGRSCSDNIF